MVRDQKVHKEVIHLVLDYAVSIGFVPLHLDFSPVKGPEGNIEYLLHLKNGGTGGEEPDWEKTIEKVVEESHKTLDKAE